MFAQVVIKDEITLYETENPDEETLSMPFYGRAHGSVNSGAIVNGYLRKVVIEAGGQIVVKQCPCGSFCQFISHGWTINNLPASTPVMVTVYSHCENGQFVEAATQLIDLGNNEYEIKAFNPNYEQWFLATTLKFTHTTPPLCCLSERSCVDECEQPFNPPALNIYPISDPDRCNDPVTDIAAGVFTPHYWNLRDDEEVTLTPCQDPMTGDVKFKYATNQTNSIDLPFNLELCPDRIAYLNLTRIDDEQEFEDYLTKNISTTEPQEACTLRQWILRHRGIDSNGDQTGGEILFQDGIWLTASTQAHEDEHKRDYEKELNDAKSIIFDKFYHTYSITCSTYSADPGNAEIIATGDFMAALRNFSDAAKNNYDTKLNEVELNGRDEVQKAIIPYLEKLDTFIKVVFGVQTYEDILQYCK